MNVTALDEEAIFKAARKLPAGDARAAYLDEACSADRLLRDRVEALLRVEEQDKSFLAAPAVNVDPTIDHRSAEGLGTLIGPYKIVELIGEGGMGAVYLAQQTEPVKRFVAIKVIKAGMDSRQVLARFEAERQALALMDHPNIARVLDAGTTGRLVSGQPERFEKLSYDVGRPYFVMELVKGVPITKFCDERKLTPRERLELFLPVCHAIQHAHQKGIIHRDIKPTNVLVALYDGKPIPKVIDFGIAKAAGQPLTERTLVTGLGAIVGTPEYMSPEQAELNQLDIDTRSDVYSLGIMLYELLAGSTPLTHNRVKEAALLEVLRVIREEEPQKPSTRLSSSERLPTIAANRGTEPTRLSRLLRGELDWVVMKALEKDRSRRYETANGFAADVQRYLAGETVQAVPPSAGYRLRKFVGRNKGPALSVALVLMILAASTGVSIWHAVRAHQAEMRSGRDRDKAVGAESQARDAEADERAFSDFLVGDILSATRPKGEAGGLGKDVTVRAALDAAVSKLAERFRGRPRAEAIAREAIGNTYRMIGDWPNADVQLRRALELRRQVLGIDHEETLRSQHNLAVLLLDDEVPDEAESLLEEVVRLRRATLGPDDPGTLASSAALAAAYRSTGRLPEAIPLLEQTLAAQKAKLGPDHPDVLQTVTWLANGLRNADRHSEAVPLFEETLWRAKMLFGPEHPDTIDAMIFLGRAYQEAGREADAVPLAEQAVKLNRAVRGDYLAKTYASMERLAKVYQAVDRVSDAVPVLEQLVKLHNTDRYLGADSPHTLGHTVNLAGAYLEMGRVKDAIPLLEDTVKRFRETAPAYDPYHSGFPRILWGLSLAYREAERFPEARKVRPLLRESLVWYAEVVLRNSDHAVLAKASNHFADLFPEQGESQVRSASFLARGVTLVKLDPKLPEAKRVHLARNYGDRALSLLRAAIGKGFSNADELRTEPAFESLRSRDDFQRLLAEMETKKKQ